MVNAATVAEGQVIRGLFSDQRGVAASAAPRGRESRPGAERGSLSSNGRPGTRQGVRTPHLRAAMPIDAYSLAVSCGGRGVSYDIWPASLVRHAPRRALPGLGHDGAPPSRAMRRTTASVRRDAGFPALRVSATCGFPGRWWCRPHPRATADMADRALRCVDRLRRCVAAWHWVVTLLRVTPSRRALPSRQRRSVATK